MAMQAVGNMRGSLIYGNHGATLNADVEAFRKKSKGPEDQNLMQTLYMNPQQILRLQNHKKMRKSEPIADFKGIGLSSIEFEFEHRC